MTINTLEAASTTFADAQREMRFAYLGGAPGMFTSAAVWLAAGIVALLLSADGAVWVLFLGGMLIHPLSVLVNKALGRPGTHTPANPLGSLGLATTFWLILSLPLAYAVSLLRIQWFFPAMLLMIGGRYLSFSTLYGIRLYWACGATLVVAGIVSALVNASPEIGAFSGAAIEAGFAAVIFSTTRRETVALRGAEVDA